MFKVFSAAARIRTLLRSQTLKIRKGHCRLYQSTDNISGFCLNYR